MTLRSENRYASGAPPTRKLRSNVSVIHTYIGKGSANNLFLPLHQDNYHCTILRIYYYLTIYLLTLHL